MLLNDGVGLSAVALLGLSAVTCGTLVFGGWRRRRHLLAQQDGGQFLAVTRPAFGLGQMPFVSGELDVAAEARDVLHHMAAEAAGYQVQLEFAVQPELSVHADRLALRAVISELVGNAMRHAPGGRVLLSAIRLGGRVQIAVIDDGAGPEAAVQEAALREVAQLVALQGGTIDVETHAGEGTTVMVRLPEPMGIGRAPGEALPPQQPAAPAIAPPQAAREAVAQHSSDI
jgi:anti-sigma regulatory factor (Ser/Thr protein kinase)